jgi:hypothetical protein
MKGGAVGAAVSETQVLFTARSDRRTPQERRDTSLLFKHKPSSIIQRQKEKSWKTNSSIFPNPKISWAPWMSTRC